MTEKLAKQELIALLVVCSVAYLFSFSFFSIHIALPSIQWEFGSSLAAIQWISIVGNVLVSSLSLCVGRLGDMGARGKLYRSGVLLYAAGSGLCALAASFPQLITSRIFMTIGLAMAFPLTGAILVSKIHPSRRGRGLGALATAMALGRVSGPTLGGMILAGLGWRGIFITSSLIGAGVSVAVWTLLKIEDQRRRDAFDIWGSASLFVGYPTLLIALSLGPSWGWGSAPVLLCFLLSVSGWVSFVAIESRTENPLIRPSFFCIRDVSVSMLCLVISWAVASPVFIFAPMYLQNVLSLPPLTVGLILTLPPLFIAILAPLSGWFADKVDGRIMVSAGLGFVLAGIYLYSRAGTATSYGWVGMTLLVIGIGNGLFQPANQRSAFSSVSDRDYGIVSAMLFSFGQASGSLGTAGAVALMEGSLEGSDMLSDPAAFAAAQQSTFAWFIPLAALGVLLSLGAKRRPIAR